MAGLRARWLALMESFAVDAQQAEVAFMDLAARYGENGRHYHTLAHIENVLDTVDALRPFTQNFAAVELAAWFHDVIYDPQAADNEAESAGYAALILGAMGLPVATIDKVKRLIQATTHAYPCPDDPDCQVLLDADLATFGSDWLLQEEIADAIRQEFSFVPEEAYRVGRRQVLQQFLQRDRIFYNPKMFEQYEERARQNIALAIAALDN